MNEEESKTGILKRFLQIIALLIIIGLFGVSIYGIVASILMLIEIGAWGVLPALLLIPGSIIGISISIAFFYILLKNIQNKQLNRSVDEDEKEEENGIIVKI